MGVKGFVHRGLVTLPVESRSPPSLTLRTARYDNVNDGYVPVDDNGGVLKLPLAEDEHVAALGKVGCRKTGLMCIFLVVASRESLTIGKLDIENSSYEVTGTIAVPRGEGAGEECLQCWLADGPTVVARYQSKVVVASERQEQSVPYLEFGRHGCPMWKATMLEGSFQRVFVAGNQVLCVSSVSGSDSSSELVRYAGLLKFSLPSDNQVGRYSPTLTKVPLPVKFDPHSITCVAYVRSGLNLPYKVVYGTSEGGLKCCSHDEVIMEVTLEESPHSVIFAEAAHAVPVLIVCLGGMDRKVVTFFADSLRQINSWTGVHQVVVDDLARVGHDQMLLITQPPSSTAPFEHCLRISLLQSGPENASDEQKSKILKSINEALEIRLQDGVKELRAAEERRLDKMLMLTAACNLMQGIAVQQAGSKAGNMSFPEDAVSLESVQLQETYMGRCFLIINVRANKNLPEGFHLRRPTLFATSLHGFVKSMTSCLPSQANSQRFLFSFPLKECHFPLHIILAAEVSPNTSKCSSGWYPTEANFGAEWSNSGSEPSRLYTQWIHSMDTLTMPNLEADVAGPLRNPTAVCEKWLSLTGGALSQDHLTALVRAVSLQTNSDKHRWNSQLSPKEGGRQNVTEEHTNAPLTSMYVHDISVLNETTESTNLLDVLSNLHGPRILEMVIYFAEVMSEEIQSCANDGSNLSVTELQAATDRCFCHLLSSITYNSFGHF
ncbi:hypothetical protein KC19_12G064500 [Ceratodon purpureus]|uniref:Uncharacterized protein n=1 Tax=Ceratodon purpureus TaxID=3225 RepID=A0A8T0GA10_CERPU|nr:hypothetical protein KC19_12G064500 [Ceratodon purpureus]